MAGGIQQAAEALPAHVYGGAAVMISKWYDKQYAILKKIETADGYGNNQAVFVNGKVFVAGVVPVSQTEQQVAQHRATASVYTIVFDPCIKLHPGMMIRRLSDGAVYEVMNESQDYETPERATAFMRHAEAKVRRVTIP